MGEILKSRPGKNYLEAQPEEGGGVAPVIHCTQEIPCNPCSSLCPNCLIEIKKVDIRQIPYYLGNNYCCQACERCVVGCPGLAITLVDYRNNPDYPTISIPYEFNREIIRAQDRVTVLDTEGRSLGDVDVVAVYNIPTSDRTMVVQVQAPKEYARQIAGVQIQDLVKVQPLDQYVEHIDDDMIVCRCERVSAGEIRSLIRSGYRDMNEIKAVTRAGMGACGGKTCTALILRLFREEGIDFDEVKENVKRPLFIEVALGILAGKAGGEE